MKMKLKFLDRIGIGISGPAIRTDFFVAAIVRAVGAAAAFIYQSTLLELKYLCCKLVKVGKKSTFKFSKNADFFRKTH